MYSVKTFGTCLQSFFQIVRHCEVDSILIPVFFYDELSSYFIELFSLLEYNSEPETAETPINPSKLDDDEYESYMNNKLNQKIQNKKSPKLRRKHRKGQKSSGIS